MNRTRAALLASFTLVALLAVAPAAGAKIKGAAQPDLVVKKVSKPPKTGVVGSRLKLVVKVKNASGANAGKSKLGLYLGKGRKHTKKDKRLKRVKVMPLAPGKGKKLKLRVTLPAKSKLGNYRLFACADDTKKVKEAKERNCKTTRKIKLVAKPLPAPPPAAAFTMSDGLDWGFVQNAQEENPKPGAPITLTLTAANGIAGQAGYTRSNVGAEGFRSGATTALNFGEEDDGQATVQLPFAFPFGGVNESTISVSTNGWVSFGSPAWDYWDDVQPYDYRGIQAVVGELERGIMPYWADLDIGEPNDGDGSVKQVVAPDNSWVAFQWETNQHSQGTTARRSFQLVLFPNGSFRFDYPGVNAEGGNKAFVGYSLGTGAASADVVSAEGTAVPSGSLQFTPNAVPAAGPTAAGEITAVLPKGSSFVSAGAGCTLTTAPGKFSTGLVTCAAPPIGPGAQFTQTATFSMPPDAPGEHGAANFRLLGSYLSGGLNLTDGDEVDDLTTSLPPATIKITTKFVGPGFEAGEPTVFASEIESTKSGLDEPTASFEFKNATITAVEIDGQAIECSALGGASASCVLPSGTSATQVDLTVVPTDPGAVEIKTTARALNAPEASLALGFVP
jgi:CARDB